jgi:hypothetical protein
VNDPDLHERLDKALGAIEPVPAPIEETMRKGTHIRWRRRTVAVAASLAAVAAAAIVVPLATHTLASPAPATSHYTVTVQPPGPHSPADEIAVGTVNGKSWRILMSKPTPNADGCFQNLGPAFDSESMSPIPCPAPGAATSAEPVAINGSALGAGPDAQAIGFGAAVAANVSYVTVTLTNGTVLTLHPVTVYSSRYVAFATIPGTIAGVTAYSRQGEIASATAFTGAGADVFFTTAWLRPGERGIPRATGQLGSGAIDGKAWSATAYLGPWGICAGSGKELLCAGVAVPLGLAEMLGGPPIAKSDPPTVNVWTVPASTVRVVVSIPGEKGALQVRPVTVGVQKFVVFEDAGTPGLLPAVTAYDNAGHVVGHLPAT